MLRGEISANSRPVDECPLCSGLGIAHAHDIIDVAMDPIQNRHDLSDPVAGTPELTLREPHELVGRTEAAGQQKH